MGAVLHAKRTGEASTPEVAKAAGSMKTKDVKDFASTKHKGLPEKKEVKEEPERTSAYKAMQASLHPRGSTVDAKQGETATAHRVGGWRNPKNRGKKRKVMAEFEPELEMVDEEASYRDFTKRARDASARVNKERQDRKDANAKSAYRDRVTKGVRFYDKKGKGHMKAGKKVYD